MHSDALGAYFFNDMEYKKHRFNIYPEMQPEEFERLRANIFANGYDKRYPIWIFEGKIIDGWNRYRACQALGIEPYTQHFLGSALDAMQLVIRSNDRRDLNSSQRAAIAVEAEEVVAALKAEARARQIESGKQYGRGTEPEKLVEKIPQAIQANPEQNKVRTQLAETFGTNPRYVSDAARLKENNPEAFRQVLSGAKTISEVKKEEKKKNFETKKTEFEKPVEALPNKPIVFIGESQVILRQNTFNKVSLLLSDPPYGMDFKSGYVEKTKWDKIDNDKRQDTGNILDEVFAAAKVHLADDAHVYIFGNPFEIETVKPIFEKYFTLKNILIWDREVIGMGDLKTFGRSYDVIYFGHNGKWKDLNGTRERDVLRFNRVSPGNLEHPTQKPLDILEYIIKKSTQPGEWVLDPFAGSFTTCAAAMNCGRNSYGIELKDKYLPAWMI